MTIEKKGNRWRIRKQKNKRRYSLYVDKKPTISEAEELINEYIRTCSGIPQDVRGRSFGSACLAYVDLKNNVLSPSTIKGYNKIIRSLPVWLKDKKLESITALDVQKVINDMSPNLSPKSVYNVHGFISAVLSVYRENLHLNTKLPLKRKFEPYTPTDEDVQRILEHEKGGKFELPYRLAVFGMRRGELLAITKADVKNGWVSINKALVELPEGGYTVKPIPKTSDSIREIYIGDELAEMIKDSDCIFSGEPNRLNKHLHDVQKRLNIPSFRLHDFRAYYVTMAHKIGMPDKFIMRNCGFSSSKVMERVYKRTQADAMEEYNKLYAEKLRGRLGDI